MIRLLKDIFNIVPTNYKKHTFRFVGTSILNIILDLISVGYFIPIFILILDPEKKNELYIFRLINDKNLIYFFIAFVATFFLKNYIQIRINRYQQQVIFNIASDISSYSLNAFLKKEYLQFQKKNTAKSIENIKIVGADFSNHILLSINTFIVEGLIIFILISLGMYFYFQITLMMFLFLGILLSILFFLKRSQFKELNSSLRKSYSSVTSELLNIITGFLEIKSLQYEAFYQKRFDRSVDRFNNNFAKLNQHNYMNGKSLETLIILCLVVFFIFISFSNITVQNQVVFISILAGAFIKLLPSINKISIAYTHFQSFKYTIDVLKNISQKNSEESISITKFCKEILLEDVSFGYHSDNTIINNFNLSIKKGDFIGITGPSGSGKTTFLNLIMNTISPQKGVYRIDNNIIIKQHDLFSIINYIPQNSFIFEGTILENILLGQLQNEIDLDKILNLAKILELQELFDQRLNSKIDLNSLELSGGQKQRIALLRSLYHDFEILILDEATNQINKKLETKIFNYLQKLQREEKKTFIYISHNPKLEKYSNQYFLIENNCLIKT